MQVWLFAFPLLSFKIRLVKNLRGDLDAARVDKVMDDIEEEKDISDQIADAITRPAQDMFDDEELLNELAELEELDLQESSKIEEPSRKEVPTPDYLSNLPQAPTSAIRQQETEEEAALRELQASMLWLPIGSFLQI